MPQGSGRRSRLPWVVAAVVVFALLVTANSGGYRYGVSDQAYYVPAILAKITPGLFPRDTAMLESQGRFSVFDDVLASCVRATGVSLPVLFGMGYLLTVAAFAGAVLLAGDTFYGPRGRARGPEGSRAQGSRAQGVDGTAWSTAALLAAFALRHQVLGTGVNSFEGYFHPRVLAFAIGALAIVAALRERRIEAGLLAAASIVVHSTTGAWFGGWIAVALVVNARSSRWRTAVPVGIVLVLVAAAVGGAALRGSLLVMDSAWLEAIGAKRYLFPNTWPVGTWIANAIGPIVVAGTFWWRRRTGRALPAESGVVWGCLALVAVFVASLPFVAAHVALAVQLQTSRVFWHVEWLATIYLVWWLVDVPLAAGPRVASIARALTIALVTAGAVRGAYILTVQFHRPLVRVALVEDDWERMASWAARETPVGAGFLVDPQHVGRYGVSFRVAAARDVFLEAVKDSAMATYSRETALAVLERQRAVPAFDALTAADARRLGDRYGLDYLITERALQLPEVHRQGRFIAYAIGAREPVR